MSTGRRSGPRRRRQEVHAAADPGWASYDHPTRGQVGGSSGTRLGRVNAFTLRPLIGYVTPHHRCCRPRADRCARSLDRERPARIELPPRRLATGAGNCAEPDEPTGLLGLGPLAGSRWPLLRSQGERARTLIAAGRTDDRAAAAAASTSPPPVLTWLGRGAAAGQPGRPAGAVPGTGLRAVTHHLEELPASTRRTRARCAAAGSLAAGPIAEVLTTELASECFGYPVAIARHAGRWATSRARADRAVLMAGLRGPSGLLGHAPRRLGSGGGARAANSVKLNLLQAG
jgi:iron complex transport system ATP-binding protein